MKLYKSVLIMTSVCLTGLSAYAVDAPAKASGTASTQNKDNEFTGEIEDPPGAMIPAGMAAETPKPEAKPEAKPETKPEIKTEAKAEAPPAEPSSIVAPPSGPATRPMGARMGPWGLQRMGEHMKRPHPFGPMDPEKRDSLLEARMIKIDLMYLMEHACSAQALRLGPATERIAASALDERKKNPDKSLFQLSLARPDLEADSYALYYHKSKCVSDFIAKRVGEDFKMNRFKDKSDLKAQMVKKALTDLRDELEKRSLNRGNERCEANQLSEQMKCVSQVMVPAMEGSMAQTAIDAFLNKASGEQTLGEAKDEQLEQVRMLIAQARTKDALTVRGSVPLSPAGAKTLN